MSLRNSASAPMLVFTWEGDCFKPLPRFARLCDRDFVVHERYRLEIVEERSINTHNHLFAELHEAWLNLPETIAERFPTSDHLRKWALIKAGYCDSRSIVCASKAEALRVAAFVGQMDEFAVVSVNEATVTVYTAKSMSRRAMKKAEFQDAKTKVLEIVSEMIGVERAA